MLRILVTGANGFLGSRVAAYFRSRAETISCGRDAFDITDARAVMDAICAARPDAVVHCAAVSDTGRSERDPSLSEAVNVRGSIHVAMACKETGAKLVWLSSDQIYNGCITAGPLAEDTPVAPENVYGRHKLRAEQEVGRILPSAVALRASWMYDLPGSPRVNRNPLVLLAEAAASGIPLRFPVRDARGLTDAQTMVQNIEKALAFPGGVYNFGSENDRNAYETARFLAHALDLPDSLVQPDPTRYPEHPRNLLMNTSKARALGVSFPSTCDGLSACLRRH